jgi:hypothetical protein
MCVCVSVCVSVCVDVCVSVFFFLKGAIPFVIVLAIGLCPFPSPHIFQIYTRESWYFFQNFLTRVDTYMDPKTALIPFLLGRLSSSWLPSKACLRPFPHLLIGAHLKVSTDGLLLEVRRLNGYFPMEHFLHYIYKALNCVLSFPEPNNKRGSAGRAVIGKIRWWLLL